MTDDFELGRKAAALIWEDAPEAAAVIDPRTPLFARGVLAECTDALGRTPGLMKRVVKRAAAAAEDLAVEVFQGLVEVLQNADDLGAEEVRFALSEEGERRKLLIVHNGRPVTCHHVMAMSLPFLTTKADDAEQSGRFGIGLKTLGRISNVLRVHSAPYDFAAHGLDLHPIHPLLAIPGFYEPGHETLLELELLPEVATPDLEAWFDDWPEDGLLFLKSVRSFRYCDLTDGPDKTKAVHPGQWEDLPHTDSLVSLRRRQVRGSSCAWHVYSAACRRPEGIDRSNKATGETTTISLALPDKGHEPGLFIAFRTRLPVTLPFSLDAQFDPTAAREGVVDNAWNRWLIGRCGEVIAAVCLQRLKEAPKSAWDWIPLASEGVGIAEQRWPRSAFQAALKAAREQLGSEGEIQLGSRSVRLSDLVYEVRALHGLLSDEDLERLCPGKTALPSEARDGADRWRKVMKDLAVGSALGTAELVSGFRADAFRSKPASWWVDAAVRVIEHHPKEEIFGVPCWLDDQNEPIACQQRGKTERPLLIGQPLSDFARRWRLTARLHDIYAEEGEANASVYKWLLNDAAVVAHADAATELAAFAEAHGQDPQAVTDPELIEIRNRFDELSDRAAGALGRKVGAALLLDGYAYRGRKKVDQKVSPAAAYLPRRIDRDYPDWPDAADGLPDLLWLSGAYEDRLPSGATRGSRKGPDGVARRGARRFLMLLGAMCSPRVVRDPTQRSYGNGLRWQELIAAGAAYVKYDYISPDLDQVISRLQKTSKKERKVRSAGLLRALSRYWRSYEDKLTTRSFHFARKYEHEHARVTSLWLCKLIESPWIAVGAGELVLPSEAVVKTAETQALYPPEAFIAGVTAAEIQSDFARAMKIITEVRASDLVDLLVRWRDGDEPIDASRTQQVYRSLAKICPSVLGWQSRIGDLTVSALRASFADGNGLIWVPEAASGRGAWRRPADLFVGKDVLHEPDRFVPGGPSCHDLWHILNLRRPGIRDCLEAIRRWSRQTYTQAAEAALIDIFQYLETLISKAERADRDRLRNLPLIASGAGWVAGRPVFHIEDRELRHQIASARPDLRLWEPPCDPHTIPALTLALGLTLCAPKLITPRDLAAAREGEELADRFRRCVDQLANELARNDVVAREALTVPWEELRELPLSIYPGPFQVLVSEPLIGPEPIPVFMQAALDAAPRRLHISQDGLPQREHGGRIIGSLFSRETRRRMEAEWVAAWMSSLDRPVELMRMASDEARSKALKDLAAATPVNPKASPKVTAPASKAAAAAATKPRVLKSGHGGIAKVTVVDGGLPKPGAPPRKLVNAPPTPPASLPTPPSTAPAAYTDRDLEQRGWELLTHALNTSDAKALVDFRARRQVGSDGAIDWRTFVELKATGRGPQSSVELSNMEYERAIERGTDFILALVSGLEEGEHGTEIRLIIDPARCATMRPLSGVRLSGLLDAPAVVIQLQDTDPVHGASAPAPVAE